MTTTILRLAAGLLALVVLGACNETPSAPERASPSLAVQGCLRDVSAMANTGEVEVLETLESEAGTQVTVGVGPDLAPWRCIGYRDGTTAGVMSMTDEGAL